MIKQIGDEFKKFIKDMEKNISNESDLKYILDRSEELFKGIINEINENAIQENKKIIKIINLQKQYEKRMNKIEKSIENINENMAQILNDIYEDEEDEIEIVCPYCNCEFSEFINEKDSEIICPECNNIIILDWNDE